MYIRVTTRKNKIFEPTLSVSIMESSRPYGYKGSRTIKYLGSVSLNSKVDGEVLREFTIRTYDKIAALNFDEYVEMWLRARIAVMLIKASEKLGKYAIDITEPDHE